MIKELINLQLFTTPVQPTTGNTFNYAAGEVASNVNFGKLLEPKLNEIFFNAYTELPEEFSKVYNIETSLKAKETDWGMGAFGDWTVRASQLDTVAYKTLSPGLERTYIHSAFTQGFMITREMFDDDQYRQMEKMPAAMARSGRAKVEKDAVTLLVNGFKGEVTPAEDAFKIYDGHALFTNNHPLLDGGGKLGKNKLTGVLNDVYLKQAIQLMREIPDEAGNPAQFRATKLIVPPALNDVAIRLTETDRITGSNFNDTNKFLNSYGIEVVVLDYIGLAAGGSDTAWYLQDGARHEMNFFWRIKPEFKWEEDYDTFVAKYRGYMRYSFGVSDWRGVVGSTGLTA